jgi:hypothetical protein
MSDSIALRKAELARQMAILEAEEKAAQEEAEQLACEAEARAEAERLVEAEQRAKQLAGEQFMREWLTRQAVPMAVDKAKAEAERIRWAAKDMEAFEQAREAAQVADAEKLCAKEAAKKEARSGGGYRDCAEEGGV